MRPARKATLRADGRWQASVTVRGRRTTRYAGSPEAALTKIEAFLARSHRGSTDGLRARTRRERAERFAFAVLAEAKAQGWSDEDMVRVLIAQLSPSRIKRDVFGPCSYCGTWKAATIDHIVPTSRGGSDDRTNLTSACWACNSRKGNRDSLLVSLSTVREHRVEDVA